MSELNSNVPYVMADEFLTPLSTPPSELEDEATQKSMDINKLAELNLTEDQFYNKLYDK